MALSLSPDGHLYSPSVSLSLRPIHSRRIQRTRCRSRSHRACSAESGTVPDCGSQQGGHLLPNCCRLPLQSAHQYWHLRGQQKHILVQRNFHPSNPRDILLVVFANPWSRDLSTKSFLPFFMCFLKSLGLAVAMARQARKSKAFNPKSRIIFWERIPM